MQRPERLEDQLQFLISTLIQRELRDPDLGFLTVTAVRLSPDRGLAKVFFTVLGEAGQEERTRKALGRAAGFLRTHLAQRLALRRVPELRFFPDATLEEGNRMDALFARIHEEEASRPPEAKGEPPAEDVPDS
ncbi:MAG: 30S ribosome-binding factor RbfA [Acidobacteria bacterium]|nr:30S ribosome-binding factor RbfA [Acidobacteriota bacterium]